MYDVQIWPFAKEKMHLTRRQLVQSHRHTVTQTHRHAVTQTRSHTDTQSHRHAVTQTRRDTYMQSHRHTVTLLNYVLVEKKTPACLEVYVYDMYDVRIWPFAKEKMHLT